MLENQHLTWAGQLAPLVALLFATLIVLERLLPLRQPLFSLWRRALVNVVLSLTAFFVGLLLVKPTALMALNWQQQQEFGLLYWLPLPALAKPIVGFLLLDLSFYYWHRLNHNVPLLWRFHVVHHMDRDMDATSAFRFHFGEVALSTLFRAVQVAVSGVALTTYLVYEFTFQCATLFHHSNWRLPARFDRLLNIFVVTPRMHGMHHSVVERENNSNFSVILSFWDRLHRSFTPTRDDGAIRVGIPALLDDRASRLAVLLSFPFGKQPDYWKFNESKEERD